MEREKTEEIKSTNPINQDEIQLYLKDIRKLKVMTPEREKILSKKITDENCTEREKELIYKELLEGNLRFVITVAKQYQNQGLSLSDLINEGNIGMMNAIDKFDLSKGKRFTTFSTYYIRLSINSYINDTLSDIVQPANRFKINNLLKNDLKQMSYNNSFVVFGFPSSQGDPG